MTLSRILNIITKNVSSEKVLKECCVKNFKVRCRKKAVYKSGKECSGLLCELVFLVDTGDWFYKTIRFELRVDESDYSIKYRKNYREEYFKYDRADYKEIIKEIINSVHSFSMKDVFNQIDVEIKEII